MADSRIRTVWHPDPAHDLIVTPNGGIRVMQGEFKAQLNTADYIEI